MKRAIGPMAYVGANPIVLVGAVVDGRPNFATIGDCAVVGLNPALVVVSLSVGHHTTRGVAESGAFSINVPSESQLEIVDFFGTVSGRDVDKAALLPSEPGRATGAPLAIECPIALECRVRSIVDIEHRRIFLADVVQAYVEEGLSAADGCRIARLIDVRPILYALDNGYYSVGECIGRGAESGRNVRAPGGA